MLLYSILILKSEEPQALRAWGIVSCGEIIGKKMLTGGIPFRVAVWDRGWDQVMEERGDKAL